MKLRASIIAFAMLIVAGCATQIPEMKRATAAKIPCQESAMKISNSSVGAKESLWDVECEGKKYHCIGDEQLHGVNCLEIRQ